jgi:hypothetical protein
MAFRLHFYEEEGYILKPMQTGNEDHDLLKTRLTLEEIIKIEGFENISDDEAQNIADTVFALASIIFEYYGEE